MAQSRTAVRMSERRVELRAERGVMRNDCNAKKNNLRQE
jgi:hypothetical protein